MNSRNWAEDETKMAFALYFLLDPREFSKSNPDAINLAFTIDRTPAAVSAKLWNISAHDTNHIEAGYSGMRHASKLDHQIWTEYDSAATSSSLNPPSCSPTPSLPGATS